MDDTGRDNKPMRNWLCDW